MLSIANMNSAQAAHYHAKDQSYYQQSKETSVWAGKGAAELLGLSGEIDIKQFERLCYGIHPSEERTLVDISERAGTDLTFSCPKSASILCELGDERTNQLIRAAHDQAVQTTLSFVEDHYAQTREQKDGHREVISTGNLIIAKFQHDTSRENDPSLHTHCFIVNATQKENGEWRALHNDQLFTHKMFLGQTYRNELAKNLREQGFAIEVTNAKEGFFEIQGVSKELISEFSQRREQVLEKYEELKKQYPGLEEEKLKEMATTGSRSAKDKNADRNVIKSNNIERAKNIVAGQDLTYLNQLNSSQLQPEHQKLTAKDAVDLSIRIQSEKTSVFNREDVMKNGMKLSLGEHSLSAMQNAFDDHVNERSIVQLDQNAYSTPELLQKERGIVEMAKNRTDPLISAQRVEQYLSHTPYSLTKGQQEAYAHILSSNESISVIQGDAGTGKTFMLKAVRETLESQKQSSNLRGLAFTGKASEELERESGIPSTTLHAFFVNPPAEKNMVYIVDEASMVSSLQMHHLCEIARENHSKIVFIGDQKQFQSLGAGNMFSQLQKQSDIRIVEMTENKRAQTELMRSLYSSIKSKDLEEAFGILEKHQRLHETTDLEKIKNEYLKDRHNTLLLVDTNTNRRALNELIRADLVAQKEVTQSQPLSIKEAINLNEIEKHYSSNYQVGQIVVAQNAFQGFSAGQEGMITAIDHPSNTITVTKDEQKIKIDLSKAHAQAIQTFAIREKAFGVGDKIVFTKNNRNLKFRNGEAAVIQAIHGNIIKVQKGNKELAFDASKYPYIDHGYVITAHKSQGQTTSKVIAFTNAQMANLNRFYVQITRAKRDALIYTNSIATLKENTQKTQIKTSTLDYFRSAMQHEAHTNHNYERTFNEQKERRISRGSTFSILGDYCTKLKIALADLSRHFGVFKRDRREIESTRGKDQMKNILLKNEREKAAQSITQSRERR